MAIQAYQDIVAARFRAHLQEMAKDPVPKEVTGYDIDRLTDPNTSGSDRFGIKKRQAAE